MGVRCFCVNEIYALYKYKYLINFYINYFLIISAILKLMGENSKGEGIKLYITAVCIPSDAQLYYIQPSSNSL